MHMNRKMAMAQEYFLNTSPKVLVLSLKQHEVLMVDGYDTISTIINWKYGKIREWCTTKSKFTTTRGEDSDGDQKIKCTQALTWWATNLTLRGKFIFLADFDTNMMAYCIDKAKLDYEGGKKYPEIDKPDKFSHSI